MRSALPFVLVALLAGSACDETPTAPEPIPPAPFAETFSGTVPVLGAGFYSFSVFQINEVRVMFGSLTPAGTDTPLNVPMAIGFGVPKGLGCDVQSPMQVAPGLTYQLSATFLPGTYCDLTVGGVATRTFPATRAGTVVVRLDSLGPPDDVEASVGIGLPRTDGISGCNVTVAIVAAAPAELSVPVVAGTYCVKIADVGAFTNTATFSISIVRP
jgi:hypothetical protein